MVIIWDLEFVVIIKKYGDIIVVDVVDYKFVVGFYFCFFGLFGCGKFLMFCMIVGYESVFVGDIVFGGINIINLLLVKCGMVMMF